MANSGGNTISILSDTYDSVIATVHVGNSPFGVTFDSRKVKSS